MSKDDPATSLIDDARAAGVTLDDRQAGQLVRYLELLRRWNSTYNLTAVRDPQAMRVQHLLDCLAVVPALRRHAPDGAQVLDVGSGGGLPGVVWAVACPALTVTCVDAVAKKAAFVRQVAGALGLANLQAWHGRVEQLGGASFDVVAARAFATLAELVRLTASALAPHGVWLAMKGRRPDDEIASLPAGIDVFHVEPIEVPHLAAERCLVWMRRRA